MTKRRRTGMPTEEASNHSAGVIEEMDGTSRARLALELLPELLVELVLLELRDQQK